MNPEFDIESLEGWLVKKKRREKSSLFGSDTKRWFKVRKVEVIILLQTCYDAINGYRVGKLWCGIDLVLF